MKTFFLVCALALSLAALGGLIGSADTPSFTLDMVNPTVDLIAPNGGEEWYIGDTHDILWNAADTNLPATPVNIWYSLNGGADYTLLAENIANSGSLPWLMPNTQSYNARVRLKVTDAYGNTTQRNSAAPFAITYVPPQPPESVNVVITNAIDALITWQPVTQTIYNTPITPDGYIILYNESPYEYDDNFYYFLGRSYTTNFTHHDVAEFRDQMYYKVVAYKNYDRATLDWLDGIAADSQERLNWPDALNILHNGGGQ